MTLAEDRPMQDVAVPEHMRAVVLRGVGRAGVGVELVPVPEPGPDQLLARVDAAGVCTSLLKLIEQGPEHQFLYGWNTTAHPLILGDEGAVTLVHVGEALRRRYAPGQRFVVQPAVDHAPINHLDRYGADPAEIAKVAVGYSLPGHLAEYILIPEEVLEAHCLVEIPDDAMAYAHAAISEPISCCVSAQSRHFHLTQEHPLAPRESLTGLRPGGVAMIIGLGAMGRMHVDCAISHRPRILIGADLVEERRELTRALFAEPAAAAGVDLRLTSGGAASRALLAELGQTRGADDVIVAVGAPAVIEEAQHLVARGGVLNLFGGLKKTECLVSIDGNKVHYGEINITGSSGGSPWDIARTLELISRGELEPSKHITRIGDLTHINIFLDDIMERRLDGKAVIYPHRMSSEIRKVDAWTADDERAFLAA